MPPLGLLLDVDGPIASTRTRTVRVDSIAHDLVALAHAGIPVVFNTGRSDVFVRDVVLTALANAGLRPDAPVWSVGEKGGTWFSLDLAAEAPTPLASESDASLTPPQKLIDELRELASEHEDLMFWDDTKRTMVSIEQNFDVENAAFLNVRDDVVAKAQRLIEAHDLSESVHIVPSIISIDVEHTRAGKALGAKRALDLVSSRMAPPTRWFTAGDSPSDYAMATWLNEHDYDVSHLDVRPDGPAFESDFTVIREPLLERLAEDDHTAHHLRRIREELVS